MPFEIKNGADILLKQAFLFFGSFGKIGLILSTILFSIYFFVKGKKIIKENELKLSILLGMIFESFLFGLMLFSAFNGIPNLLIIGKADLNTIEQLYLAIGAGIFEEFIFRLLIIGTVMSIGWKILDTKKMNLFIPTLIASSFIFSGFHYVGVFGDSFDWRSFFLRFSAGGYLGLIFYFRGFAICAITHIFYDFIIIQGLK